MSQNDINLSNNSYSRDRDESSQIEKLPEDFFLKKESLGEHK